jgi:cytochrome P450
MSLDANKSNPTFQTVSILLTFFLAMLMNPEAQRKAQEEIDRVIGTDRLPTFEDEPKLPYVTALAKEVFRWQQVAPFGMRLFSLRIRGTNSPFLRLSDPPSFNGG